MRSQPEMLSRTDVYSFVCSGVSENSAERMMLHSAILDQEEKMILKDALLLYVSNLQKRYYRDNLLDYNDYEHRMGEVSSLVEKLKLSDLYR